jgi:ribonuclease HIII
MLLAVAARQPNQRPREILQFETPAERFNACVAVATSLISATTRLAFIAEMRELHHCLRKLTLAEPPVMPSPKRTLPDNAIE